MRGFYGLVILGFVAGGAFATPAAPARAAATAEQRCQAAVPPAADTFFKNSLGGLAACQGKVDHGTLPPSTDCFTDATVVSKRVKAFTALDSALRKKCTDGAVASLTFGGGCTGAQTVSALVGCISGSHTAAASGVIGAVDAGRATLSAAALKCQTKASTQVRSYTLARLGALKKCKLKPSSKLPMGSDCTAEPSIAAHVAKLRGGAAAKIAASCQGAALAQAQFGPPCTSPSTGDGLAACLLAMADTAGDGAIAAEFRNTGFCGDAPEAVEKRIDDLLAQMTLAEKIGLMAGSSAVDGVWRTPGVSRLGIPGFGMIDGARGVGIGGGNATCFPVGMARGATWDPILERQVGDVIGTETRAKGASVLLAPVLNNLRHPRWGRAQETYGEDTFHIGQMGVEFTRGVQKHVIANPKHFAANSIENTRFDVSVTMDERTLREIYLAHFEKAVQLGHAASLMSAYNKVDGQYCAENAHLLHDIVKGDWGFQGFIESDWLAGTRSTVPSATAGLDIEMPYANYYGQPLNNAVAGGQVSEATIDAAARRIVRAQLCFRLDSDPPQPDPTQVETAAHTNLTLQVARESIVLLKNDQAVLPLDRSKTHSIVVVGGLAAMANLGDHGSSWVTPSSAVAPLDGILAGAGSVSVTYQPTVTNTAAVTAADAVVVVAGLTFNDEGEGLITIGDRGSLALPGDQDQVIASVAALNPRTIVVLEGSGALLMPWMNNVAAILMAWYPGQEGGTAIADVLFGDVTPSGKLPVTFPRAEQDLPPFDNITSAVTYGYYHGYRYLDRNGVAPLFPFGFGLSYTTFQYSNLTLTPTTISSDGWVHVTADVTNTGAVAGDEVAQLYIGYPGSSVDHAINDLKGFTRVHIEPGQTETAAFDVRATDLAFWDTTISSWKIEPITYDVRVGSSSRDLPLAGSFSVTP